MPVAPSFQDLVDQYEAEAVARRPDLLFRDGDITQAQQHGAGAMADSVVRYGAQAFKETFLDGARGDALTTLVNDRYNIQRSPASAAQVTLTFERTSGGAEETFAAGTVAATEFDSDGNEIRFETDGPLTFGAGIDGPLTVAATAVEVGRAGNAAAGTITRIITSHTDQTFTVTNVATAGGGNEEESDPELRRRARSFFLTLRGGTLDALEFGALTVATVRVARATESATGLVTLVVADSDGNSTLQMIADVIAAIQTYRAAGSIVTVAGGTQLLINVAAQLVLEDGVDIGVVGPLAEEAIEAEMAKLRQGEVVYLTKLASSAIAVDPAGIKTCIVTAPAADVTPTSIQTPRAGTVTVTEAA
jgi:uncharacterized phage protein gp47/JayE